MEVTPQIDLRTMGNGLVLDRLYYTWTEDNGRLMELRAGIGSPYAAGAHPCTNRQWLKYTYDDNGNILTIADDYVVETRAFDYDELNRLEGVTFTRGTGTNESMTYNASTGNLVQRFSDLVLGSLS
jgi:hypothetical protein